MRLIDQVKSRVGMKVKDGAFADISSFRRNRSGKGDKKTNFNDIVRGDILALTYRDSDYSKAVIDYPVDDALQNWRSFNAKEEEIMLIEAFESKLDIQRTIRLALSNARLYGGCAIYMGVDDGKKAYEELDISRIGKDGLLFLQILPKSRFELIEVDNRIGENYGKPVEYKLAPTTNLLNRGFFDNTEQDETLLIHPSRLIILTGSLVPNLGDVLTPEDFWGYSLLQGGYEGIESLEKSFRHVLQLLSESKTTILKVPGFGKASATGGEKARRKFAEMADQIDDDKGNYHTIIMDKEYDYEQRSIPMTGIDAPVLVMMQWISGQAGIPLPRLFGVSPNAGGAGLSSGRGLAQENIYNKKLNDIQQNQLRPSMTTLTKLILRSVGLPDTLTWTWNPLEIETRKELMDSFLTGAQLIRELRAENLLTPQEGRQLVLRMAKESKFQIDETDVTDLDTLEETPEETPAPAEE